MHFATMCTLSFAIRGEASNFESVVCSDGTAEDVEHRLGQELAPLKMTVLASLLLAGSSHANSFAPAGRGWGVQALGAGIQRDLIEEGGVLDMAKKALKEVAVDSDLRRQVDGEIESKVLGLVKQAREGVLAKISEVGIDVDMDENKVEEVVLAMAKQALEETLAGGSEVVEQAEKKLQKVAWGIASSAFAEAQAKGSEVLKRVNAALKESGGNDIQAKVLGMAREMLAKKAVQEVQNGVLVTQLNAAIEANDINAVIEALIEIENKVLGPAKALEDVKARASEVGIDFGIDGNKVEEVVSGMAKQALEEMLAGGSEVVEQVLDGNDISKHDKVMGVAEKTLKKVAWGIAQTSVAQAQATSSGVVKQVNAGLTEYRGDDDMTAKVFGMAREMLAKKALHEVKDGAFVTKINAEIEENWGEAKPAKPEEKMHPGLKFFEGLLKDQRAFLNDQVLPVGAF